MPHVIEAAASGRAKCRGCGEKIVKGELRLGERLPNPYGEGEMTLWFHPLCAAYKRPEPLMEAMSATAETLDDAKRLETVAEGSLAHRRLPRVDGAGRAPTGRARCRACRELIEKGSWRVGLVYYDDGRFEPSGYIHAGCASRYFETADIVERIAHFARGLGRDELDELASALA